MLYTVKNTVKNSRAFVPFAALEITLSSLSNSGAPVNRVCTACPPDGVATSLNLVLTMTRVAVCNTG